MAQTWCYLCLGLGLLLRIRNQNAAHFRGERYHVIHVGLYSLQCMTANCAKQRYFFLYVFLLVHFIADSDNHRTVSLNKIYDMRHKSPITDFSFFKVLLDSHMIVILWSLQLRTCVALCICALELSSTFVICHHPFPKSSLFFFFLFLLKLNAKGTRFVFSGSIYWTC